MANIMEAVPVDLETAELGRLRLNCIKELCGKKVFTDPITLVIQELSESRDVPLTSDRGQWFPHAEIFWDEEETDDTPEPPSDRNKRRRDRSFYKKYESLFRSELQDLLEQYPLKKCCAIEMLAKGTSPGSIGSAIHNSVSDLDFLGRWYMRNWSQSTQYSHALRAYGNELSSLLTTSNAEIKALHVDLVGKGVNSSELQKRMAVQAKELAEKVSQEMIVALSEGRISPNSTVSLSLESTPSVYVFCKLLAQIFLSSVVAVKNTRKARDSDLGDLVHSMYLPYVDIFRADGATASALRNAQIKVGAKIVTNLDELVVEVEGMIASCKSKECISV
ncbi:hypothetical protein [Pseudomonas sp. lyk4-40-TSB-59a]|uniref:hypothetical protein n=1 Tax=Pseudomonas sp. lyk4-40-TSB-59a TaxID=3040314 RepID=UPI002553E4AF|nr:hypothetical protein [Pseudomonas sp. lyk4-40-TSB-59a]